MAVNASHRQANLRIHRHPCRSARTSEATGAPTLAVNTSGSPLTEGGTALKAILVRAAWVSKS